MWYIIYTYFLKGNQIKIVLGASGTCWSPWWMLTMRSRSRTSRSWSIFFFSYDTSFIPIFFKGNPMKIVLGTSGICWSPWWTSTSRSRSRTPRSWSIIFCHVIHHLYLFFKGKSNKNSFRCLRDLLVTMVDVDNEV